MAVWIWCSRLLCSACLSITAVTAKIIPLHSSPSSRDLRAPALLPVCHPGFHEGFSPLKSTQGITVASLLAAPGPETGSCLPSVPLICTGRIKVNVLSFLTEKNISVPDSPCTMDFMSAPFQECGVLASLFFLCAEGDRGKTRNSGRGGSCGLKMGCRKRWGGAKQIGTSQVPSGIACAESNQERNDV